MLKVKGLSGDRGMKHDGLAKTKIVSFLRTHYFIR